MSFAATTKTAAMTGRARTPTRMAKDSAAPISAKAPYLKAISHKKNAAPTSDAATMITASRAKLRTTRALMAMALPKKNAAKASYALTTTSRVTIAVTIAEENINPANKAHKG